MNPLARWARKAGETWLRGSARPDGADGEVGALGLKPRGATYVFVELAQAGRSANELRQLMSTLNLDPERLARSDPTLLTELATACSLCDQSGACRRDLRAGRTDPVQTGYCPNSETLRRLCAGRGAIPASREPATALR